MWFAHYLEDFADNEGFLQATYQVALQVEKKKALRQVREQARTPAPVGKRDEKKRDGQSKGSSDDTRKNKEAEKEPHREGNRGGEYGETGRWASEVAAFQGVPDSERKEYAGTRGCHCCGRLAHRAAKCFAGTTAKGTSLPAAPWKIAAGTTRQRVPKEEIPPAPAPKVQKTAALDVMDCEPLWAEEEDF